ncbi:hypothetical protein PHMEG_00038080 [Phytophthora megakarya]|uniref:Reverse transcriptase n=1 Tax=Phytophthora megakarya TaxID=4795 RepID=A0A225UHU2_9STRA|nr:hypothetical protein PHMEG_00038080 [Phytophthora megakarya]
MVVDIDILDRWPEVICSPLGAVEKKGADPNHEVRLIHDLSFPKTASRSEVRLIHDLSFPKTASVNSAFVAESVPKVRYASVSVIAQRIEYLATHRYGGRIRILKGDVKGAFRHLRTRANQGFRMTACVKELRVAIIDMAAPLGWTGSPSCYASFGRAISWLMGTNSPASVSDSNDKEPFFPYEWVDDHILVEPDIEDRLQLAEATLRHAMLAVLGPRVSIPNEKVVKARLRVEALLKLGTASKTELNKVLGSLKHVAIFLRAAKPFYQRLQGQSTKASRFGRIRMSRGATADLFWFQQILQLGCLAELPLAMFGTLPTPDVVLLMGTSDSGLVILDPASNEFIQ